MRARIRTAVALTVYVQQPLLRTIISAQGFSNSFLFSPREQGVQSPLAVKRANSGEEFRLGVSRFCSEKGKKLLRNMPKSCSKVAQI